ncbi:MAG: hypothetical protein ACM335_07200 [Deltaproteobacteria bacterium]
MTLIAFINALRLKLPGKFVMATHEVRKDNSGKDRVNVTRFEKAGGYSHHRPTPADPEHAQAGDVQDNEGEGSKPVHTPLMDVHCG